MMFYLYNIAICLKYIVEIEINILNTFELTSHDNKLLNGLRRDCPVFLLYGKTFL